MIHRLLVTGATGFLGSKLVEYLNGANKYQIDVAVRDLSTYKEYKGGKVSCAKNFRDEDSLYSMTKDVDTIIHCAAKVHVINDRSCNSLEEYRSVNVDGALNLARRAASNGCQRFIFISTVGVVEVPKYMNYGVDSTCPINLHYAISKGEAEEELLNFAEMSGMDVVIIRPPLIYGPNAPGNFDRLIKLVKSGVPLPFKDIDNRRSFIALDNLIDLIDKTILHPDAANSIFTVSDGNDLSTPDLIRLLAETIGCPARLYSLPESLIKLLARIFGKQAEIERLIGSFQVDITRTCEVLDWSPLITVKEGFRRTFQDYQ